MNNKYCQIIVDSKTGHAQKEGYTYLIKQELADSIQVGQLVLVPFGRRLVYGVVVAIHNRGPLGYKLKSVQQIIDKKPILNKYQIALANFISDYYFCSPGQAIFAMIPSFVTQSIIPVYYLGTKKTDKGSTENKIINFLFHTKKPAPEKIISEKFGPKSQKELSTLVKKGLIIKKYCLLPPAVKPKIKEMISLNPAKNSTTIQPKTNKQKSIIDFLKYRRSASWTTIRQELKISRTTLDLMIKNNLLVSHKEKIVRSPEVLEGIKNIPNFSLTIDQAQALQAIQHQSKQTNPKPILLFGRTGSGKTEIYLQAAAATIQKGKNVIVLVPEIALLPQTILRFLERFQGKLAIYHSHMSLGERHDQWMKIFNGQASIVIGSRSALFTPLPNLGLIIIDEEHEFSYKQDMTPRYHAVTVAKKYCELTNSQLILGSATPRLETFWQAKKGHYQLLRLNQAISELSSPQKYRRPEFFMIDLRDEFAAKNKSLLSYSLQLAIRQALTEKKQILLFLNRRGLATYVFCRECGYVALCSNCHIPLTYHINLNQESLVCHHCGQQGKNPRTCPQCSGHAIKFYGAGTQKVHQDTSQLFPEARILRMDHDTTQAKNAHHKIFASFKSHQADILIGTQMIAKGWDLPNVDLIGIINADAGFNLPDFRSTERNFSLLLQLIGRVGRGQTPGKVFIQSFDPENPLLETLTKEDYQLFAYSELIERQKSLFPPFVNLVRLLYESPDQTKCRSEVIKVFKTLNQAFSTQKNKDLQAILGPSPTFLHKIKNKFRWHIILKGQNLQQFLTMIPDGWTIDVDPYSIL